MPSSNKDNKKSSKYGRQYETPTKEEMRRFIIQRRIKRDLQNKKAAQKYKLFHDEALDSSNKYDSSDSFICSSGEEEEEEDEEDEEEEEGDEEEQVIDLTKNQYKGPGRPKGAKNKTKKNKNSNSEALKKKRKIVFSDSDEDEEAEFDENKNNVEPVNRGPGRPSFKPVDPPVGYDQYPAGDWSLTITKRKDDVPHGLIDIIGNWIKDFCEKGGVSTEVGTKAFKLHLQGLFRCRYPTKEPFITKLSKY
jgi:hypothetical protein